MTDESKWLRLNTVLLVGLLLLLTYAHLSNRVRVQAITDRQSASEKFSSAVLQDIRNAEKERRLEDEQWRDLMRRVEVIEKKLR